MNQPNLGLPRNAENVERFSPLTRRLTPARSRIRSRAGLRDPSSHVDLSSVTRSTIRRHHVVDAGHEGVRDLPERQGEVRGEILRLRQVDVTEVRTRVHAHNCRRFASATARLCRSSHSARVECSAESVLPAEPDPKASASLAGGLGKRKPASMLTGFCSRLTPPRRGPAGAGVCTRTVSMPEAWARTPGFRQ